MPGDFRQILDREIKERTKILEKRLLDGENPNLVDVFTYPKVRKSIEKSKIVIPSFVEPRILMAIAFSEEVFVLICPACECVKNKEQIQPYLERGAFTPILLGKYAHYPRRFVEQVIKKPHLAGPEFHFFRHYSLLAKMDGGYCDHCMDILRRKAARSVQGDDTLVPEAIDDFFKNLSPFCDPDLILLDRFLSHLSGQNFTKVFQLASLSATVRELKTAQAFAARPSLNLTELNEIPKEFESVRGVFPNDGEWVKSMVAGELGLIVPRKMDRKKYLDLILNNKERLSDLVNQVIASSGTKGGKLVSNIMNCVADINDEILKAQKTKRFLAYKGFSTAVSGNVGLISAGLLAALFGLNGSLLGCATSILGGAGAKFLKKKNLMKTDNIYLKQLTDSVREDLRPVVNTVSAPYLGVSRLAMDVWQLREETIGDTVKSQGNIKKKK